MVRTLVPGVVSPCEARCRETVEDAKISTVIFLLSGGIVGVPSYLVYMFYNPNALPGFVLQTKQMPHYTVAAFLRSWGFIYW